MVSAAKRVGQGWEYEPMVHSWVPLDIAFSQREPTCPIRSSLQAAHFQWLSMLDQPKPWLQIPQVEALFLSRPVPLTCLQTPQWGFGSQTTPWMAIDGVLIITGHYCWAVVKTTWREWNEIQMKGNVLRAAVSRVLESFKGNSNSQDNGIKWSLLSAEDALEKDKEIQLIIMTRGFLPSILRDAHLLQLSGGESWRWDPEWALWRMKLQGVWTLQKVL